MVDTECTYTFTLQSRLRKIIPASFLYYQMKMNLN